MPPCLAVPFQVACVGAPQVQALGRAVFGVRVATLAPPAVHAVFCRPGGPHQLRDWQAAEHRVLRPGALTKPVRAAVGQRETGGRGFRATQPTVCTVLHVQWLHSVLAGDHRPLRVSAGVRAGQQCQAACPHLGSDSLHVPSQKPHVGEVEEDQGLDRGGDGVKFLPGSHRPACPGTDRYTQTDTHSHRHTQR